MTERERFFELLPFHVNATLDAADAQWLRDYLQRHPELAGQLRLMQALQLGVRDIADAALRERPADAGYARLRERIAAEWSAASAPAGAGVWQRALARLALPSRWRLAQGLALGLALGIAAMFAIEGRRDERAITRSAAPAAAEGPLLRVNFVPSASENDIRLALIEARASIVAGPTRLGDYYLKIAGGRLAEAGRLLLRSGVAQRAEPVPSVPAELRE